MAAETPWRKKLIEVAIPLDAINRESAREKSIRHGHPSTLHLWWARRPLAACRAVIFCSLVDDPGEEGVPAELLRQIDALEEPRPLPADWDAMDTAEQRRQKLFKFIETLVEWESTTKEDVIGTARELILAATEGNPPPLLDPFCGGGSIPLEAQRLGLEAHGSDLNPVAVLITKALIELPPKFAGMPPVNPDARGKLGSDAEWKGAAGLAEDVRWYGEWMRQQAWERIGHLYPQGPNGETVIAWLWARTVKCPNPACGAEMPLAKSFQLSKKKNREAWVHPQVDQNSVRFEVRTDNGPDADGTVNRNGAVCIACETVASLRYVREQAQEFGLGTQLMAVVTDGDRWRNYVSADPAHEAAAVLDATLEKRLDNDRQGALSHPTPERLTGGTSYGYGLTTWDALFTSRQLAALTTFSDLVGEARDLVRAHAAETTIIAEQSRAEQSRAEQSRAEQSAYADAVATYLGLALSRLTDWCNALATWQAGNTNMRNLFARQAIAMVWDFAELNPFADLLGIHTIASRTGEGISRLSQVTSGHASQSDATRAMADIPATMIVTDPPYYDNIVYADISDFFYVWLRRTLHDIYPEEFSTLLTPKAEEMVAAHYRFAGGKEAAERHFENGLHRAFDLVRERATSQAPLTMFYAYKQTEEQTGDGSRISTGWEKMLTGLLDAGFTITGTWPMRTESRNRVVASGTNALATSVVLVCRPRPDDAPMADIGEFNRALASELPEALRRFIGEHIAPVDLPQASIGPGMAVFSRYSAVVRPNGDHMTVREALELINAGVEQFFSEREGAFDGATQFCLRWFEQFGFEDGPFGDADTMARAKDISVEELQRDGLLTARRGRVQLLPFERYEATWESWEPSAERRLSAWRACHYLAAALEHGGVFGGQGEHDAGGAALLARELGGNGEQAKELAYRLYAICDAKGWASEARRYNALADAWSEISAEAGRLRQAQQGRLG